jgi:pilus assembly protein Flp/PilA
MKALIARLLVEEKGQDIIEYALLAAAISVVAIPTVPAIGTAVNNAYEDVKTKVSTMPGAGS